MSYMNELHGRDTCEKLQFSKLSLQYDATPYRFVLSRHFRKKQKLLEIDKEKEKKNNTALPIGTP